MLHFDMTPPPHSGISHEAIVCSVAAAVEYDIPADVLLAIAETEGGRPGLMVRNSNGSVDIGPMQFNSAYLRTLQRHGIRPGDVNAPGCYPYRLAAWRVKKHLEKDSGDVWQRASNYHSYSPAHNAAYRSRIKAAALRWARWLIAVFAKN